MQTVAESAEVMLAIPASADKQTQVCSLIVELTREQFRVVMHPRDLLRNAYKFQWLRFGIYTLLILFAILDSQRWVADGHFWARRRLAEALLLMILILIAT